MADIKLGTDTLSGVDTIQVRSAADDSTYVQYKTYKEGTTILNTQTYNKIYLNPNVTEKQMKAAYDSLTEQTFMDVTGYILYALMIAGDYYLFTIVPQGENHEDCDLIMFYTNPDFSSTGDRTLCTNDGSLGWYHAVSIGLTDVYCIIDSVFCVQHGTPLQSFNGLPIGEENEKLKNIFSATPFI